MKLLAVTAVLALAATVFGADFLDDFLAAYEPYTQRKWADASAAFSKLAETAPAAKKDKCYSYAARAMASEGKYEEARAAAAKIRDESWKAYTEMSVMTTCGKGNDLLAAFKGENIDAWPEEIAYLGFMMRGAAMGNTAEAIPDLKKAVAEAGSDSFNKGLTLNRLIKASLAAGDTESALKAADTAVGLTQCKGKYFWFDSALQKAQILTAAKRYDEAKSALELISKETEDIFRFHYLEACGDLEFAKGDKAKAVEIYHQALGMNIHNVYHNKLQNKVDKLK